MTVMSTSVRPPSTKSHDRSKVDAIRSHTDKKRPYSEENRRSNDESNALRASTASKEKEKESRQTRKTREAREAGEECEESEAVKRRKTDESVSSEQKEAVSFIAHHPQIRRTLMKIYREV